MQGSVIASPQLTSETMIDSGISNRLKSTFCGATSYLTVLLN